MRHPGTHQGDPFYRLTADKIAELIARAEQCGMGHQVPLLRALGANRTVVLYVERGATALALAAVEASRKPVVIVIHDDDHATSGPTGFPIARKALRWARAHIIHGTGGEPWHYGAAVEMALSEGSCAVCETSSAMVPAWADLARRAAMPRRAPGFVLLPRTGAHPVVGRVH
ncbi:hypothetical protein GCM10011504_47750 [Siccirubricoccus deserti]|uniref:Uncharacterized protein n=1 Tax=Siccirubricoccus deserti TaxID=2013562 RepID=A0A9X0UF26_9PROT|nr:hypothetical protein [Siccirubricoccus deserti]MBC4018312.1 hypothetical protein [Siccirubricoccus deserti]GGC63998.1 hypothetical protein GCM10011504_47750 [Siccirubricoccus deserti]